MALTNELVSQFAKITKQNAQTKSESIVYGTVVEYGESKYVQLDGSNVLTPYTSTTNVAAGERVTVMIKNHTATVTGNKTSPAVRNSELTEIGDKISDFEIVVADKVDTLQLVAVEGRISELEADNVVINETLIANKASINDLETKKLSATDADIKYANIDFSNIGKAAMEYFYAKSGLIDNVVVGDQTITGNLVGVTINGDRIEGNTVIADKLVIKGDDGLYYKLNTDGMSVEAEQTEYNSLNGSIIQAKSITATKIDVKDLVAFDATIGGFKITDHAINSITKTSVDNTTRGIYMDNDGQFVVGDASNFMKYYKTSDGSYKLEISLIDTLQSNINSMQTKIDAVPGQITAAVGDIRIGGTNLIRETGWYDIVADPSAGWEGRDGFTLQPYNGGTDDFPDTGFVQWDLPASLIYLWSPDTNVKPGETYTVSLRYRGTGSLVWYGRDANWNQIWSADEYYTSDTITEFSATRTIPDNVVHLKIVCEAPSGTAGALGCIKLERGNKATAWSPHPMDRVLASGSVVYGSDLNITKDRVIINTPELDINVSGANGDAHFGAKGFSVDVVNSPSVLKQYTGPTTLTITQYANEVNGVDRFATMGDAFAKLSNCFLPYPVSITHGVPNLVEANAKLQNTCGSYIHIYGNSRMITGQIIFESVQSRIIISSLTVQNGSGSPMVVNDCTYVRAESSTFVSSANYMGMEIERSTVGISGCSYRNCHAAVRAQRDSYVSIYNCSGNANVYSVIAKYNTRIGMLIKRPASTNGLNYDASCSVSEDPGSGESSGSTTPAATTTVTLTATNTRTHAGGWYSGTNVLSQGIKDGTSFYGYMWFDLSSISGKTIKAATIRLYRKAGVGRGSPVDVYIGTHNASGPSGGLSMVNAYSNNLVGKVDQKETLTASITVAAIQELASGSAKGLFIHSGSSGYAQFEGYDGSVPPQLTVTYQ